MIIDFKESGGGCDAAASSAALPAPAAATPCRGGELLSAPGGSVSAGEEELIELVRRAQAGDLQAQAELVRRYRVRVKGFVRPMLRSSSDVEDLAQMIWLKMVQRMGGLREPARFETWLFTLARNTVLDYLRRNRCRPVSVADESLLLSQPDPFWREHCRELMEAVELALRECRPRERRVLRQLVDGASYRSIATREGVSLNALKVRVHRLRLFLRLRVREATGEASLRCGFTAGR